MEVDASGGARSRRRLPDWVRAGLLTRRVQFALDLAVLVGAFAVAYLLRFEFALPELYRERALLQLPLVVMVQFVTLTLTGVYTFVWRYVGMREVGTFLRAGVYSALPLILLRVGLPESFDTWRIPLSVIIIDAMLAFGGLLALRVTRRAVSERFERVHNLQRRSADERVKRTLLVGAGRAGVLPTRR